MLGGETRKGVGDLPGLQGSVELILGRQHPQQIIADLVRPRGSSANTIDHQPMSDRSQPRPDAAAPGVQRLGMPPRPQQRLLDDVLRALPVTVNKAQHVGQQRAGVLGVERPDHDLISPLHQLHTYPTNDEPFRFNRNETSAAW